MGTKTQRAAVISAALCACLAVAMPSYGGLGEQVTTPTQQVESGQWGAAPSTTTLDFGVSWTQQLFFSVTNSGTLPLVGATYIVSGSNLKNGTTLSLLACVGGTWDMNTGACLGGQQQTITSTTGAATSAPVSAAELFPAGVGTRVTLQATLSKVPNRTSVGSVTVTVDRSQVRAATVTNG
jgi:hypothetical protein